MILNGKRLTENERMKLLADMEHEECEALEQMVPAAIAKRDPLHELEKLQAASLVMMARDIDSHLPRMGNIERGAFGRAARQLAAQLLDAARKSDRYVPDELPDYLKADDETNELRIAGGRS